MVSDGPWDQRTTSSAPPGGNSLILIGILTLLGHEGFELLDAQPQDDVLLMAPHVLGHVLLVQGLEDQSLFCVQFCHKSFLLSE